MLILDSLQAQTLHKLLSVMQAHSSLSRSSACSTPFLDLAVVIVANLHLDPAAKIALFAPAYSKKQTEWFM